AHRPAACDQHAAYELLLGSVARGAADEGGAGSRQRADGQGSAEPCQSGGPRKSINMKAMVLRAPSDLVLDEVARPEPAPGQVLIRVTHSGVCGTDYKIYNGSIKVPYPLIPGHEMVGARVDTGERVIIDHETYDCTCSWRRRAARASSGSRAARRSARWPNSSAPT